MEKFKTGTATPIEGGRASCPPEAGETPAPQASAPRPDRTEQKKRDKRLRKIDEEIAQLEARINSAEGERERNDMLLCAEEVFRDGERVKKIQQQNHDLKAMIELLYGKWEVLSKEKEELEDPSTALRMT